MTNISLDKWFYKEKANKYNIMKLINDTANQLRATVMMDTPESPIPVKNLMAPNMTKLFEKALMNPKMPAVRYETRSAFFLPKLWDKKSKRVNFK